MRIVHILFSFGNPLGIRKQIQVEEAAAFDLGLNWVVKFGLPGHSIQKSLKVLTQVSKLWYRVKFHFKLLKSLKKTDVVLLRYAPCDVIQLLYVILAPQKVVLLHHTLELPELRILKSKIRLTRVWLEVCSGFLVRNFAYGICGVTEEIRLHQIKRRKRPCPSFEFPNGIHVESSRPSSRDQRHYGTPRLLFVASDFVPWHGLDILLEKVRETGVEFILDVVGKVHANHLETAANDERVIFHGVLDQDKLTKLIDSADVGLSCFALERKGMKEACPLKVREYLSHGLPVYSGHRDVFPTDFPFYKTGECSIECICDYALKLRSVRCCDVIEKSIIYINKDRIMKRLYQTIYASIKGSLN
ncbi:glycosyltransferase [Verrucomicrobiaceae bacterium 227]